jgi:thiol-disulfide isomerase/thioredoxin
MADLGTQLRTYLEESTASIEAEEIFERLSGPVTVPLRSRRGDQRQRPGWVYALAAALGVLLIVGGAFALATLWGGDRGGVLDDPDPVVPGGALPPFQASVVYDLPVGIPSELGGGFGRITARIQASSAGGNGGFRLEVSDAAVEGVPAGYDATQIPTAPAGSYITHRDGESVVYYTDRNLHLRVYPADVPAASLGEFGWQYWRTRCGEGNLTAIGEDVIAGRPVTRLRCESSLDDPVHPIRVELWLDEEAQVVLKAWGQEWIPLNLDTHSEYLGLRPIAAVGSNLLSDSPAASGGFEITSIEYGQSPHAAFFDTEPPQSAVSRRQFLTQSREPMPPEPLAGTQAGRIRGELSSGGAFDGNQLTGRPVVVVFWSTWCECFDYLDQYQAAADRYSDAASFVTIAYASPEDEVRAVVQQKDYVFPVIVSPTNEYFLLLNEWGLEGVPTTVMIDAEGVIVAHWGGTTTPDRIATTIQDLGW